MNRIKNVTWTEIFERLRPIDREGSIVYGVPKGGMIAAGFLRHASITHDPSEADIILDDLVDSGHTRQIYKEKFPDTKFACLYDKQKAGDSSWIVFPWERDCPSGQGSIQDNIVRQIQYIGEDPNREGLKETPNRIVRSWKELFSGYGKSPKDILTIFDADKYDEMVILKDIEFFSMCEHHLLPFFGKAHVAYIPNGKIIGISKLARLVDIFARRMQIQERIGEQVTDALMKYLHPLGAACIIKAVHMCMRMRGVQKQNSVMITSSLKGIFIEDSLKGRTAREELMQFIK